jgi:hypothetical protein
MSTIVWTTLITAAAAVTGSLGAVWIKGHFDDRTEERKAKETSVAEVSGRRREAYAQLLTTARKALEQARLRRATFESTGKVDNAFILSPDDLAQVVALAELLGSPKSHPHVRAIYDKAIALNNSYFQLAMPAASPHPGTPAETVSGPSRPRSGSDTPLPSTSELETAINSFVVSVRPEFGD